MKKHGALPIGEIVKGYFAEMGLSDKINEQILLEKLSDLVGPFIVKYITKKYISNKTLYIYVSNSILRGDLTLNKAQLMEKLNRSVSESNDVIRDIIVK